MAKAIQVFLEFLVLGLIAFGGPMAHLAWFERAFVGRLGWLTTGQLSSLIALCQALPGPASSQTAMGIGYMRAGWRGLGAAWIGFTLPAAALMGLGAYGLTLFDDAFRENLTAGMKVAVVAVVAVALWRMGRSLLDSREKYLWTLGYALFFLFSRSPWVVLLLIALVVLLSLHRQGARLPPMDRLQGFAPRSRACLVLLPGLLLLVHALANLFPGPWTAMGMAFYQTGLLVFGGGHVVLPLLEGTVVATGWISREVFLFGYGLAQMVPGPLFSFSAYLGASFPVAPEWRPLAALFALLMLYLPSFLLLTLILPTWHGFVETPRWKEVLRALHPLVVGLLLATWIDPVLLGAMRDPWDAAVAAALAAALFHFPRLTLPLFLATASLYVFLLS